MMPISDYLRGLRLAQWMRVVLAETLQLHVPA